MFRVLESLPGLLQAIARHLFAYGELAYAETLTALRAARRRLLGLVVACGAGVFALALGCLWIIAATWDGPNRLWAVGGLFLGFLLITLIGVAVAFGGGARAGTFEQLRAEWRADLEELARLDPALVSRSSAAATGATGAGQE